MVSQIRTILVPRPYRYAYGRIQQPAAMYWPIARVDDVKDYSLNLRKTLGEIGAAIVLASASVSPSGEAALFKVGVDGPLVTVWIGGGVEGRIYSVKIAATLTGGQVAEFVALLPVGTDQDVMPAPPTTPAYGPPITWTPPPNANVSLESPANSQYVPLV